MKHNITNHNQGFTLIEVLLSLTMVTAMLLLISAISISFLQTRNQLNRLAELQTQANNFMRIIREDIRWSDTPVTLVPNTITANNVEYIFSNGSSGTITRDDESLIPNDLNISSFSLNFSANNRLPLITISFTISYKDDPELKLSPVFTFSQIRRQYGP